MTDKITLEDLKKTQKLIAPYVNKTPFHTWKGFEIDEDLGKDTDAVLKLELFQKAGTFKARGAIVNFMLLTPEQKAKGVTAVSAGNHAIAVAVGAREFDVNAKVVMIKTANPARIAAAKALGAEVIIGEDARSSFDLVEKIAREEGRTFIHPFDGRNVALGTGTLGLEFAEEAGPLDALIIPIGGGGLASGVSTAFKLVQPNCKIYGVEPTGADSMKRSFEMGTPQHIVAVQTIADSLGAPMALQYSYDLCRENIDELCLVEDTELKRAMSMLFREMKLAVEPAGAATTAALLGPLKNKLQGKRVGLIICGANIDIDTFHQFVSEGECNY